MIRCAVLATLFLSTCVWADKPTPIEIGLFTGKNLEQLRVEAEVGPGLRINNEFWEAPLTLKATTKGILVTGGRRKKTIIGSLDVSSLAGGVRVLLTKSVVPRRSSRLFSGTLRINRKGTILQVVDRAELESYVSGVLEPETRDLYAIEMLKAQAIAIRTYVLQELGRHRSQGFDVCDLPHCQVYQGVDRLPAPIVQAVEQTRSKILTYRRKPINAYYHSTCGGETEAVNNVWAVKSKPYLVRVKDQPKTDARAYCAASPHFAWRKRLSRSVFETFLRKEHWLRAKDRLRHLQVIEQTPSGRARKVLVKGYRWSRIIEGNTFYQQAARHFGWTVWKSSRFRIERKLGFYFVEGSGYGHGLGLCQWGAQGMARAGKNYKEILEHYYPDTKLGEIEPTVTLLSKR